MKPLFMLELEFNSPALYRFLHIQGFWPKDDDTELSYGIHAWLGAAFGELAPKPWRLLAGKQRPPRVLGYVPHSADALQQRLVEFVEPSVLQVCPEPMKMISSREMPRWQKGRRLGFQTLICPVGRKAGSGLEKDLFLIHADSQDKNVELSREEIYCNWARQQFHNYLATVDSIQMTGFRLISQKRQTQSSRGKRNLHRIVRPHVILEGEITVGEPDEFTRLLGHGLGRHRAFGYGMILLRPPS